MRANTLGPRDQGLLPAGGFEPPNGGIKIRSIPACNINARPKADMKSNVGASAKGHNRTWWLPESLHSWNIRCGSAIPSEAVRSLVQVSAFFGNLRHFRGLAAVPSVSLAPRGAKFAPESQIFVKVSGRKLAISEFLAWRLGSNYRRPLRNLTYRLETSVRC